MDILQRKKNPWIETLVKAFPGGIPKQSFAQLLAVNPSVGSCSINDGACVIDAIIQPDCLASAGIPFSAMEGFVVKLTEFTLSVIGVGSGRRLGLRVTKMDVHSADNLDAVGPSKPIYSSPAYKQISIDAPPSPLRAPSALTQLALHVTSPSVATVPASWLPKGVQLPVITGCISAASCVIPPHSARLLDAIVSGWRSEAPAAAAAAAPPVIIADSQAAPPAEPADLPVVVNVHDSLIWRSTFAPHTIVPPSGGTQPLPPNPNPLLPNQAPPELVAESPLDPVGILALFLSQGPSAPSPATQQPAAATQQPAAAPSEQPQQPAAAPPPLRPALPRDAKRRRLALESDALALAVPQSTRALSIAMLQQLSVQQPGPAAAAPASAPAVDAGMGFLMQVVGKRGRKVLQSAAAH